MHSRTSSTPSIGADSPPPQSVSELRISGELDRTSLLASTTLVNGSVTNGQHVDGSDDLDSLDPIQRLQKELNRTKEEKDALAVQYSTLLSRLTTMRTTLGNKLKQDAEELDRREQLLQQLTHENTDLRSTVETLQTELISSNDESERVSKELEIMRSRALQEDAQEALTRERELRETQADLERCRIERDEWERALLQERVVGDETRSAHEIAMRDLELEREAREREAGELEVEREKATNLQSVLEDFQAARDHEIRQAVKDFETRFNDITVSLAEFKHRALTAELQLEESSTNVSRTRELEKEVKEKNLLIGKLRHEAVIMNEHLVEALRRLRRTSTSTNVDRRLVSNILIQFLSTPRGDTKRFEMLNLLSSILSWTDDERQKAGLQQSSNFSGNAASSIWSKSTSLSPSSKSKALELEKTDETESFSRLWVEFLLTEAAAGEAAASPTGEKSNVSLPGTPTRNSFNLPTSASHSTATKGMRRLASLGSAMSSSPNLALNAQTSLPLLPPVAGSSGMKEGESSG